MAQNLDEIAEQVKAAGYYVAYTDQVSFIPEMPGGPRRLICSEHSRGSGRD